MAGDRVAVRVSERTLQVSNLDKVLYPAVGFRKRDVLSYYQRAASALLPHLRGRAATLIRFPNGVDGKSFFEKDVSRHAPDWLPTAVLRSGAEGTGVSVNHHVLINDLATLVWTSNLAALELHVPQWTVGDHGSRHNPDLLVFDLDPGNGTTIVECCRVAEILADILAGQGLRPYPKTSGSKGLQLYCPIRTQRADQASAYAKRLAHEIERDHPREVVATMSKAAREGKVFIDWSQNNPAKTTIAPYSLRAREQPTVSTPVTWAEVRSCRRPEDLRFSSARALARLDDLGDLFADLHADPYPL